MTNERTAKTPVERIAKEIALLIEWLHLLPDDQQDEAMADIIEAMTLKLRVAAANREGTKGK
jgi:hypothetical protein